jgi:hypothetical protein
MRIIVIILEMCKMLNGDAGNESTIKLFYEINFEVEKKTNQLTKCWIV